MVGFKESAAKAEETNVEATDEADEKQKKRKPRKVIKRKSFRRDKSQNVEEVTNMVDGLKVNNGHGDNPDVFIEESKSQPQSRRNSTLPSSILLNPSEITRCYRIFN